jgi:hypothetical protein
MCSSQGIRGCALQIRMCLRELLGVSLDGLEITQHDHEEIVEVVGYSPTQLAYGFHLL